MAKLAMFYVTVLILNVTRATITSSLIRPLAMLLVALALALEGSIVTIIYALLAWKIVRVVQILLFV